MKWVPAVLWFVLPPRARGWGLVFLALSGLLSLVMLPLTIIQLQVLFGFGNRPIRADYLVFIWSAVPWWWRRADPFAFLRPAWWRGRRGVAGGPGRRFLAAFRADPRGTTRARAGRLRTRGMRFLGLDEASPDAVGCRAPSAPPPSRPRSSTDRARRVEDLGIQDPAGGGRTCPGHRPRGAQAAAASAALPRRGSTTGRRVTAAIA